MRAPPSLVRTLSLTVLVLLLAATSPARAQESRAVFDAPVVIGDPFSHMWHLLELDGDGRLDALGWWWTPTGYREEVRITGSTNDGTGALTEAWSFVLAFPAANSGYQGGSSAGQLDGDGLGDFAVAFGEAVWLYTANAVGAPTLYAIVPNTLRIRSILLDDFNADGLDDLALHDGTIRIHLNDGAGGFTPAGSVAATGDYRLHRCEANGDGQADLMVVNGTLVQLLHVVDGRFTGQTALVHSMGIFDLDMPVAGDIDGDGDEDVVLFQDDMQYTVFRRTSGVNFDTEPVQTGGPATHFFDVDGDGDLDGACCGGGGGPAPGTTIPNRGTAHFRISINDGSGVFAPAFEIETQGSQRLAGATDLDGDGDIDLVSGRSVYYAPEPLTTAPHQGLPWKGLTDRAVLDADGDGDEDLLFGVHTCQVSRGDGAFDEVAVVAPDPPGNKLWRGPGHPGDFDGDGDTDLLVSMVGGPYYNPPVFSMRLLENNGAGHLFDGGPASAAGEHFYVDPIQNYWFDEPEQGLAADADGDGDVDFFARGTETYLSRLYINNGSGYFAAGGNFPAVVKAVTDLNGDAFPDLVLVGSNVRVRIGLGGGAFRPALVLPNAKVHGLDDDVAVADLDADGDVDIAVIDRTLHQLVLHRNDGAGAFTPDTTSFAAWPTADADLGSEDNRVFALDLNADGLRDLVALPMKDAWNASYLFLRQAGGASFETPVSQVVWPSAFTDVDGDGDPDAVSADSNIDLKLDDDLLVRNRRFEGAAAGSRRQYGAGTPGTGGVTPVLGAVGPFRSGETVQIRLTGLKPGSVGIFTVGLAESNLPNTPWNGITALAWPWLVHFLIPAPGPGVLDGDGSLTLTFLADDLLASIGPLYHQVIWGDAGATWGRSATQGLEVAYQPAAD